MPNCPRCGEEKKNVGAHLRYCKAAPVEEPEAQVEEFIEQPSGEPTILPDWTMANVTASVVGREIKMLRPVCATCQRGKNYAWDWWKRCPHSPYVALAEVPVTQPVYEDVPGQPGKKKLVGTETIVEWVERPIHTQISALSRVSGTRNQVMRKHDVFGFIFPEELRTPTFPNGIKNPCEFRDCFNQVGVKQYRQGRFCRDIEAQLVGFDEGPGALEVGEGDQNLQKQRSQLERIVI